MHVFVHIAIWLMHHRLQHDVSKVPSKTNSQAQTRQASDAFSKQVVNVKKLVHI